jgi:glycosyltransferase involved in cell wall biosynthesis
MWTGRDLGRSTSGVSVVVPCFNGRAFLGQCLDSIVALGDDIDEAVVVDDGSTEPIFDLVERYAPRVRYVRQENAGPGAARTRGMRETSGRYIRFLDADDWLLDGSSLAAQVALLDAHPKVGLVYGRAQSVDRDGHPLAVRGPAFARGDYARSGWSELEDLLFENYIPTSSVIVRRSVAERVGAFRSDYSTAQDWEYWLRLARAADVGFIHRPVSAYRVHQGGITGRKTLDEWLRIRSEILDSTFSEPAVLEQLGHLSGAAYAHVDLIAAGLAYVMGQPRRAKVFAVQALVGALRYGRYQDAPEAFSLLIRASISPAARERLRSLRTWTRGWRSGLNRRGVIA